MLCIDLKICEVSDQTLVDQKENFIERACYDFVCSCQPQTRSLMYSMSVMRIYWNIFKAINHKRKTRVCCDLFGLKSYGNKSSSIGCNRMKIYDGESFITKA